MSCALLLGIAGVARPGSSSAQETSDQIVRATRNTSFSVPLYKSRVVDVPAPVKRVSIGNPDIADVLVLGTDSLYVLGKDLGATNVLLWDRDDQLRERARRHRHSRPRQPAAARSRPCCRRRRSSSRARNATSCCRARSRASSKMDAALQVANGYLEQVATAKEKIMFEQEGGAGGEQTRRAGQVINLMTVGGAQQVMLQVRVAEVSRDAMRNLNAQMNALSNNGKWVARRRQRRRDVPRCDVRARRRAHSDLRQRHQRRRQSHRAGVRRVRAEHAGHQQHRLVRQLPEQRVPGERRARCLPEARPRQDPGRADAHHA